MKRTIAGLLCAVSICADAGISFQPTPLGVGITLAQWVFKDRQRVFQVDVTSIGNTVDQARRTGFQMAVERAVGTIVTSETEVAQLRIQRNEIITYASGYVSDYEIVNQQQVGNQVHMSMRVWVSHSALSKRLLNVSRDAGGIDGNRVGVQLQSIQQERTTAIDLLGSVLADYPVRAFDIVIDKTQVIVAPTRQGHLQIPFTISWNSNYINSLAEAIKVTNQRSDCGKWFTRCRTNSTVSIMGRATSFYDDTAAYDLIQKEMILSAPRVQISIRDTQNTVQYRQCFAVAELSHAQYAPWYYAEIGGQEVEIDPNHTKRFVMTLNLGKISFQDLDRVEILIIRNGHC
jgi:hypothetical protein